MDYSAIGLNQFLMPLNSPITSPSNYVGGFDFNTRFDRDVVTAINIRSLTANRISTGTLTAAVNLGALSGPYLIIDGPNNRIVVNDGTTNRIVIGSV